MTTKSIMLGDLFKVYFIWGEYFYIELVRPLERRDFLVIKHTANSIAFIQDHAWEFDLKFSLQSNGSRKDLHNRATCTIQFAHTDMLTNCIRDNLGDKFTPRLQDNLKVLTDKLETRIEHAYNYKGCPSHEHKVNKDKEELVWFKNLVEGEDGNKKLGELYSNAYKKIESKLVYLNTEYNDKVRYAIRDSSEYHDSIRMKYSEKSMSLLDTIEKKRFEIEALENDIKKLCIDVGEEHKRLLRESLENFEDIPSSIKSIGMKDIESMVILSGGERRFNTTGIYIRKP